MKPGFRFWCTAFWCGIILTGTTQVVGSETQSHSRKTRSIKDALPKDEEFSQSRAIAGMRNKIFNLESTVQGISSQMTTMAEENSELQKSVVQQKAIAEKIDEELVSLKVLLSQHSDMISDIEKLTANDENLFVLSNQTCGGVLVGQSGSIIFNGATLKHTRFPSSCVWTIRANNRGTLKITTHQSYRSYSKPTAYVVEVLPENDTSRVPNFQIKATRLERSMTQVFNGPMVFVAYMLTSYQSDDYNDIELQLHYEGLGNLTKKSTFFTHVNLPQNSGNFSTAQVDNWARKSNVTYESDYTSLVVSNFSTKVHLQAIFENGRCGHRDTSFLVITNLLDNATIVDCCVQSCDGKNSLINYDNPFIILIQKKYQVPINFTLTWDAEIPYPSSSIRSEFGSVYGYKCGEVLGGSSGTIMYKPHVSYRNGERCIWAIVPQPRPRTSIVITIGANGVESTYDHLYMVELTDVNGTLLEDAPKITRVGRYGTFTAHSREVYIAFYSDSSVTGYGFSISWRSVGEYVKTGQDVTTRFTILKGDEGTATSLQTSPSLTRSLYQVFMLTPTIPYSYTFGMQLLINQTQPEPSGGTCLHDDISVYTSMDGVISKPDMQDLCHAQTVPGQLTLENADGMAMIVLHDRNPDSHVAVNFTWREEYGEGNSTYVSVDHNDCGGVIKGSKGVLKYKIGMDYYNNERCVWLLHSPNHTSITLKLLKDGFETCCDSILVTTINASNGTLNNDTTIINRANRTRTYEESVLVIVFRSDASTRGRGFALQFYGSGELTEAPEYRYQLQHHNEPFGSVRFPDSEWQDEVPGTKEIFLIASSLRIGMDEDPLTMPTNISWTSGVFRKDTEDLHSPCSYESITFYTTPDPSGWLQRERFPSDNDTESCPREVIVPRKSDICNTVFSAFVSVYRRLPYEDDDEDQNRTTRMAFTYEKSAGCGGVLIGDSGEISYKQDGKYSNLEKCVWLLHVPQASQIRFSLEVSGFEACCDTIFVGTPNDVGLLVRSAVIHQGNRTATVPGPVAVVVFASDSSVTGDGFRLKYFTLTNATAEFPFTYQLEHHNQPKDNEFIFQGEQNKMVIAAFSPELHRQTYQGTGKTQVTIASFRPQLDPNCTSDMVKLYDVYGYERNFVNSKSFDIHDVVSGNLLEYATGNCTAMENSQFNNCSVLSDCGDAPSVNTYTMETTVFVVIYKGANVPTGDLQFRSLAMTSRTNYTLATSYRK